jgi:hypothetical protein
MRAPAETFQVFTVSPAVPIGLFGRGGSARLRHGAEGGAPA